MLFKTIMGANPEDFSMLRIYSTPNSDVPGLPVSDINE